MERAAESVPLSRARSGRPCKASVPARPPRRRPPSAHPPCVANAPDTVAWPVGPRKESIARERQSERAMRLASHSSLRPSRPPHPHTPPPCRRTVHVLRISFSPRPRGKRHPGPRTHLSPSPFPKCGRRPLASSAAAAQVREDEGGGEREREIARVPPHGLARMVQQAPRPRTRARAGLGRARAANSECETTLTATFQPRSFSSRPAPRRPRAGARPGPALRPPCLHQAQPPE